MENLGRHLLAEYYGCSRSILDNHELIQEKMIKAAKQAGATVIESVFHKFNPFGVSGVVVIAESHLTVHTWPEHNYAAVDIFTCGDSVDPADCHEFLVEALGARSSEITNLTRGSLRKIKERNLPSPLVGERQVKPARAVRFLPKLAVREMAGPRS